MYYSCNLSSFSLAVVWKEFDFVNLIFSFQLSNLFSDQLPFLISLTLWCFFCSSQETVYCCLDDLILRRNAGEIIISWAFKSLTFVWSYTISSDTRFYFWRFSKSKDLFTLKPHSTDVCPWQIVRTIFKASAKFENDDLPSKYLK